MYSFKYLEEVLIKLKDNGLYRELREVNSAQSTLSTIAGKEYVIFCSNNYLSLANHPKMISAAKRAIDKYGCSASASRLISGSMTPHLELERKFAELFSKEAATLFTSGWCANQAVITTLPQKGDILLLDKYDHASIVDAAKESPAVFRTYRRENLSKLEKYLSSSKYNRKFIVTESIFSMDGDMAELDKLVSLKEKYGAILILDEAHSLGCMGKDGAGFAQEKGLLEKVDIIVATLGKAIGASGAVVAGESIVKEFLVNKSRGLIYTTASPPSNSAAALEALDIIKNGKERRERLWQNSNYLHRKLKEAGFNVGKSSSYIIPVIIGDDFKVVEIANELFKRGFFVPAIRVPTVAPGEARLRISLQADHTRAQLDMLFNALVDIAI